VNSPIPLRESAADVNGEAQAMDARSLPSEPRRVGVGRGPGDSVGNVRPIQWKDIGVLAYSSPASVARRSTLTLRRSRQMAVMISERPARELPRFRMTHLPGFRLPLSPRSNATVGGFIGKH
jgi:hypothetical protein